MPSEIEIKALLASLSGWEAAGYVGLLAVLVGVIGETVHEFSSWPVWTWWKLNGGRISALILIGGLAIEGVTQVNANNTSGRVIAALGNQEAATRSHAAEANKVAAQANERAISLEGEANRLRLALEAAKAETLRISQGVSSRHVLAAQKALISSTIQGRKFGIVITNWSPGAEEEINFVNEIAEAFSQQGIDVKIGRNAISPGWIGLYVMDNPQSAEDSIPAQAMAAAGIDFTYKQTDTANAIIRVGTRKSRL